MCTTNNGVKTLKNCPVDNAFMLKVSSPINSKNYVMQEYIDLAGRQVIRSYSAYDKTWVEKRNATKDDLGIYFTATGSKAAVYKQNVVSVSIQLKAGHTYFLVGRNGVSIPNDGPMSAVFDVSSDAGTSFHLGNSRTTMSNGGGCVTAMIIKTVKDCTVNLIGYGYVNETYNYDGRIIAIQLA